MNRKLTNFFIILAGIICFAISPMGRIIIEVSHHYLFDNISKAQMTTKQYYDSSKHNYEAFNSSIAYHEYYFRNNDNLLFQNNNMYHEISDEEINFLKSKIETHKQTMSEFDKDLTWYSFDSTNQVKINDLMFVEYKDTYSFKIYYYDLNKSTLYYFLIELDK